MSDNSINEAVVAAPESENTASPDPVENGTPGEAETPEERKFSQEEMDAAVGKRLAKERRKWEREQAQSVEDRRQPATPPQPDQFPTVDAYAEALVDFRADEKLAQREQQKRQHETESTYAEREEDARGKYDDFQDVVYNPNLRITTAMAETAKASDIGPEIVYYLGKNPKESARIAQLSPLSQAREIGRIEASLTTTPNVKKTSSAPEPIKPVGTRSSTPSYDTSDPRSVSQLSTSDWIKAENARRAKLL